MHVKVKMNKNEFKGLMTIVKWVMDSMGEPGNVVDFLEWDALRELSMEMLKRIPDLKESNSVTLKDGAMIALINNTSPDLLPAYEYAVYWGLIKEVDQQWQKRMTVLKSNMLMIGGWE